MQSAVTPASPRFRPMSWKRASSRSLLLLLLLVLLVLGLRLAAPHWVKQTLNSRLATMGDYHGHLESVDLQLWRGAYTIHDLLIRKKAENVPVPFLKAPRTDISLSWREIFRGSIVGDVDFEGPELNFVDGLGSANGQTGRGVDWREVLEGLVPIKLNEVRVRDGTVAFRAFRSTPPVNVSATALSASVTNLTNVRGTDGRRVANFVATAKVLGDAPLESKASFDPIGTLDDFVFDLRVLRIDVTRLNPVLQAYARLDVTSGRGDFVMELEAKDGVLSGYAKPLFQNLKVLSWKQDLKKTKGNPLLLAWEAVAAGLIAVFKNQPADQFATRIPIHGNLKDPKLNRWDALVAILRNAFQAAFRPQFEGVGRK
jgi:hypothetical protein